MKLHDQLKMTLRTTKCYVFTELVTKRFSEKKNSPFMSLVNSLKFLRYHCLRFPVGRLKYPGETGNNGYVKFWGNKVHYGLGENCQLMEKNYKGACQEQETTGHWYFGSIGQITVAAGEIARFDIKPLAFKNLTIIVADCFSCTILSITL